MSQHVTPKKGGFSSSEARSKIFFLAPALFLVFVLSIFPTIASLFLAISRYGPSGFGGFVWLGNFVDVLGNRHIWETLGTTLIYVFFGVSLQYILGFGLALLLTQKLRFRRFFRVLFLIPMMITPVAVAYIMRMVFDFRIGPLAPIMGIFGLQDLPWLGNGTLAKILIILGDTWQWTPFILIVMLAGLETLPHEPYEAAVVDGATPWELFWHITFPMMLPVSSTVILIRMVEAFKIVDMPIVLTGGGPGVATESTTLFAYSTWRSFNLGQVSAIGYILLFTVTLVTTLYVNTVRRRIAGGM
jgi:multiple sugar transport system permease protein